MDFTGLAFLLVAVFFTAFFFATFFVVTFFLAAFFLLTVDFFLDLLFGHYCFLHVEIELSFYIVIMLVKSRLIYIDIEA